MTNRSFVAGAMAALVLAGLAAWSAPPGPLRQKAAAAAGTTYYVATTGDDAYDGLAAEPLERPRGPFRTLQRAANAVKAGDTVLIRGGIYESGGSWGYERNGTASSLVTVAAYPGETVVIDGAKHTRPANRYTPLMQVYGDWYIVRDLEFRYGSYAGLNIIGDHCIVRNVLSHHNWGPGIFASGESNLIDRCRVHDNSLDNEKGVMKIGWGFGISLCAGARNSTVRHCAAWNNWGEGISIASGYSCTIEDCVAYDNFSVNIYISQSVDGVCQRNLSFYTPGNPLQRFTSSQNCLYAGDEGKPPESIRNRIINNLCWGGDRCLLVAGDEFEDLLVAYNTFVNAFQRAGRRAGACVYFLSGVSSGGRFVNNIVLQEGNVPVAHLESSGVTFDHNGWSRTPVPGCRGNGDVIGDPKLLKAGPTGPGSLRPEWFQISVVSPVRGRAVPLEQVHEDIFRRPRSRRPDMGAFEFAARPGAASPR